MFDHKAACMFQTPGFIVPLEENPFSIIHYTIKIFIFLPREKYYTIIFEAQQITNLKWSVC